LLSYYAVQILLAAPRDAHTHLFPTTNDDETTARALYRIERVGDEKGELFS